jgi:hypothetical protein
VAAGKLLQPAVNRPVAHRLSADALNLLCRAPVGDMHAKTDPRLQRLVQKPHLLRDRQGLYQRCQAAAGFAILNLGEAIRKIAHRTAKPARFALMSVFAVALRIFLNLPRNRLLLDGLQERGHNGFQNLRGRFLEPGHQTIDCQLPAWYRKHQAQIHRDLAQRIPPFLKVGPNLRKRNPYYFARI